MGGVEPGSDFHELPSSTGLPGELPVADTPEEVVEGAESDALTPRHHRAIAALMTEQSIHRAAVAAGVSEKTLHNWLALPHFAAEYRRVRREAFRQAVSLSQRYATAAVVSLAKILADAKAPYSAKVSAAQALLKFGRDGIEIEDLEIRVDDLERTLSVQERTQEENRFSGARRVMR